MSRHIGRGGMGSHKHFFSGRSKTNKLNAMRRSREVNRELKIKALIRELRKSGMKPTIEELMKCLKIK